MISVLEALDSVASCIPLPENWESGGFNASTQLPHCFSDKPLLMRSHQQKNNFFTGLFKAVFRESQAAGALDFFLREAGDLGPKWREWGETGWPKLMTEQEKSEASEALVHMAGYFERYQRAHQEGRLNGWPRVTDVQSHEGKFKHLDDESRLQNIGFERAELISFLDQYEIPHSLSDKHSAQIDFLPTEDKHRDFGQQLETTAPTSRIHSTKESGSRNVLDQIIDAAIASTNGSLSTSDIWPALIEFALDSRRPFTGAVESGGLLYRKGVDKTGVLTRNALDLRLKRRRQKLGNADRPK